MDALPHWAARAGLTLAASLFLLPFLNPHHGLPIPSFYTEWLALVGGCLTVACFPFATGAPLRIPLVAAAPLLLAIVVAIQQANGLSPYAELTLATTGYLLWCAALMFAGANLDSRFTLRQVAIALASAALAGSLANTLFGAVQLYGLISGNNAAPGFLVSPLAPGSERIYGNLAQANHFSSYLLIGVNAALYLRNAEKLTRCQTWLAIITLALASILSGSRGQVLYWALTLLLWKDFFVGSLRENVRMAASITILVLLAASIYLIFGHETGSLWFSHGLSRLLSWGDLSGHRLYLARHAVQMFLEAPFLGVGFHQFAQHMFEQSVAIPETGTHWIDVHSHNVFLQLLAVTGILGLLAVAIPLARWVADFHHLPRSNEKKWALATLGILGMHSLVEYPLWYAHFLGIAALLLGMFSAGGLTVTAGWKTRAVLATAGCCGIFVLALYATDYRTVESKIYGAEQAAVKTDGFANPGKDALLAVYRRKLFSRHIELTQPGWVVDDASPLAEKLALSGRVIRFAPSEGIAYRHAILLAANGDTQAAVTVLRLALAAYPQGREAFKQRVEALSRQNPALFKPLLNLLEFGSHA